MLYSALTKGRMINNSPTRGSRLSATSRLSLTPDVERRKNKMKFIPLFLGIFALLSFSCSRAPSTADFMPPLDEQSVIQINDLLDEADGYNGPRQIRIYLSRSDGALVYRVNDREMDKGQFEKTLDKFAEIDHRQTLAIEFGEGTSEQDLDETPAIKQFFLVGRNGRDRDSLRIIK